MKLFPFSYAYTYGYANAYVAPVQKYFSYFSYAYVYACAYAYVKVWTSPKLTHIEDILNGHQKIWILCSSGKSNSAANEWDI